ncbi:HoxN/HupN/NixA family nickel/cobalt transporter [Methanobacterium aggregans]|uniref:HoxN/HupN/NixA family nickel/cobalt transporter n=1 Tax=Methanobacterium aggregans TaxID=1615586 RepID=UPI001AE6A2B2|nr:sulfite exporter TauE/SafE family protein [Methanobacterium aggregans]MBP2047077.1 ABC-type nickel/cobalt efflux system permease component RcnA [Methanobacterium aggregans]
MDFISSSLTTFPLKISLFFMVAAFILGALHALEPGHGKAVMAAFVMGTDASLKDTLLLGGTVVFSHVIVVVLLGIASLFIVGSLNVSTTHDIMSLIGGIILIAVGLWIVRKYHHPHHHHHEHNIDTKKGVVAIGLSTGLIPCPAALAVLLFSIGNGQIYNGIIYVLVFSTGLAISITLLSVLFVKGKDFIQSYVSNKTINKIPIVSGTIIVAVGFLTLLQPIAEYLLPFIQI